MLYSLLILASPHAGDTVHTAQQFAQDVLARGHDIHRVFFLDDGVLNGSAQQVYPQDERAPASGWVSLAEEHDVELILCVSSALKRGMLDAGEAERYERDAATVHPAFVISGLGQLVDATLESDRVVTFGGTA